jgi:hypothetical protein
MSILAIAGHPIWIVLLVGIIASLAIAGFMKEEEIEKQVKHNH